LIWILAFLGGLVSGEASFWARQTFSVFCFSSLLLHAAVSAEDQLLLFFRGAFPFS